ncbi:MAG: CDP-glycerol glycerophosphotransferase family protein [Propionibacteriaceae bacterium]|jgi:CDP-glycerol glycerophosphotransferase (TagB/SpsB family)|nr:CDP-glycerol glycerophosphotransferase family protein [Propionibacteriaceae bacterium]
MMLTALRDLVYPLLQGARNSLYTATYWLGARLRPMRENAVILATVRARDISDNLAYIEAALDRKTYDVTTYSFARRQTTILGRLGPSLRFIWAMAQTKYTIVDDFLPLVYPAHLRPGARLVQVWHALGAFKRVGYSRAGRNGGPPMTSISHKNYTDVIVSADSIRSNYAEAFGVSLQVVRATGVPRTDLFFDTEARRLIVDDLRERIPRLRDRRIILFAPTFRGIDKRHAKYPADFVDLERLGDSLNDTDLLVIKMHPFVTAATRIPGRHRDKMIDLSSYPEFNHLLLLADVLVTDYSSAVFDYALLDRPVVFHAPDLANYILERGFYYDFRQYCYGPVTTDTDELIAALSTTTVDHERLAEFCQRFLNRCDGHATERFMRQIFGVEKASDGTHPDPT